MVNRLAIYEKLPEASHLRQMLDGKTKEPLRKINARREKWGLPPLSSEWDVSQPSRGLGDAVAKGIHTATFGLVKPCGDCKWRQAALNRIVPFRQIRQKRPTRLQAPRPVNRTGRMRRSDSRRPRWGVPVDAMPYTGTITRDLIYHVWPTKHTDQWLWNLDQLIQRIDLFNGRRIMGIVVDGKSHPAEAVMDYMAGHGFEFVVRPNSKIGEVLTFPTMLEMIRTDDPNRLAFYLHAKGVRYSQAELDSGSVRHWAAAQYEVLLDDVESVEAALMNNLFAGSFRAWVNTAGTSWQYSGTFWAMRSARVFARKLPQPKDKYGGVELWPAQVSSLAESACLFVDNAGHLALKEAKCWREQIEPQLQAWRAARQAPVAIESPVAFVTAAWGGYLEKFGREWIEAIARMNPRPKDVVIVSDHELDAPSWVRQFRPVSSVHNWDWFNEAVQHARAEWVVCVGIDDLFHSNGLARLKLEGDAVAFAHTHVGNLMAPTADGYAKIMERSDNPMYGGAVFRRDVFLRFPWRRVVFPDWYQWIEFRHAGVDVRCDPTPRFVWRRHKAAHSSNRHPRAMEQIVELKSRLMMRSRQCAVWSNMSQNPLEGDFPMADEIKVRAGLVLENGTLTVNHKATADQTIDQAVAQQDGGTQSIGTSAENIGVVDVATLGWAWFKNLDGTNYVELGVDAAGFLPVVRLNAGEQCVFRLAQGITLQARANTAAVLLQYAVLNN